MNWETPSFIKVKMDSEINSYQDDSRNPPDEMEQEQEALVITGLQS